MIFELNWTGQYLDFKVKLKRSVREKLHQEGLDATSEDSEGKRSRPVPP